MQSIDFATRQPLVSVNTCPHWKSANLAKTHSFVRYTGSIIIKKK